MLLLVRKNFAVSFGCSNFSFLGVEGPRRAAAYTEKLWCSSSAFSSWGASLLPRLEDCGIQRRKQLACMQTTDSSVVVQGSSPMAFPATTAL